MVPARPKFVSTFASSGANEKNFLVMSIWPRPVRRIIGRTSVVRQ